jgi:hypothetical protein
MAKKTAKKKKSRMYFTQETEDAIIKYNKEENPHVRNMIYREHIDYPFDKLAENIIHTFKFYYFDVPPNQVKHEVVSFLVMNMHKFQEGKGKAFSYFSIVAKNYLILHNNNNYKKLKTHSDLVVLDRKRNYSAESTIDSNVFSKIEFINQMLEYWSNNMTNIFKKQKDINVADAVLHLFRNRTDLEIFNKKGLYILVREMTGSKTQHITRVVNVMKQHYYEIAQQFVNLGQVDTKNTGSIF